jgi:hypothetical protein
MRKRRLAGAIPLVAALAALGFAGSAHARGTVRVDCVGEEKLCTARVPLAGGASNKQVIVELTGTNLKLVSQTVDPEWVYGAYSLTKGSYRLGGSEYTATLNAVESIPKGALLWLTFAEPGTWRNCGTRPGVRYLSAIGMGEPTSAEVSCGQAAAVASTWRKRLTSGKSTKRFSVRGVSYRCQVVPTYPQNIHCDADESAVRFQALGRL